MVVALLGCSDDPGIGDERADQAREAAVAAGLDDEVADFLALAARGSTATYQATYPGPEAGSRLVVANRPPDRRIDVIADSDVVETRLVLDGQAFRCPAGEPCEQTDAVVGGPGLFDVEDLEELTASLEARRDDFTFAVETATVAGVEARCLVTTVREGRDRPELGDRAEICVSPEGVLLRVTQGDEPFEATDYATEVPEGTFARPDLTDGG